MGAFPRRLDGGFRRPSPALSRVELPARPLSCIELLDGLLLDPFQVDLPPTPFYFDFYGPIFIHILIHSDSPDDQKLDGLSWCQKYASPSMALLRATLFTSCRSTSVTKPPVEASRAALGRPGCVDGRVTES